MGNTSDFTSAQPPSNLSMSPGKSPAHEVEVFEKGGVIKKVVSDVSQVDSRDNTVMC